MKKNNEKIKPIKRPKESEGQNPAWPGEKLIKPGTVIKDGKETTHVPVIR